MGIPCGSTPATCPVRAVADWLAAAGIAGAALFRPIDRHGNLRPTRLTDQSVALSTGVNAYQDRCYVLSCLHDCSQGI